MRNYWCHIRLFILRYLLILILFSLSRFVFYLFNHDTFEIENQLGQLHLAGIRFDLSALFYFNVLFIMLSLIPGNFKNSKIYQIVLKSLFILINSFLLMLNFIDVEFFKFESRRMTSDIFTKAWLGEDFLTLLPQFMKDFWYIPLICMAFIVVLWMLYPGFNCNKKRIRQLTFKEFAKQVILFIFFFGLCFLGGRGGFQLKPLRVSHAAEYTNSNNIPLVLNTPFSIMKTIGIKAPETVSYFDNETELETVYTPMMHFEEDSSGVKKYNVVLIILEGFSNEYIGAVSGKGYTPNLDSIIAEGLFFKNCFANGKRSIESLPSIIAGIPHLFNNAFITSPYSTNNMNTVVDHLQKYGYSSSFFHGGKNGTMGFDVFTSLAGFDGYYGMDEYGSDEGYDGKWGIYDEPFFDYFLNELDKFDPPFFTTIYTLSSHHPYQIPEEYRGKFPEGTLDIHESIGYTDYVLGDFFNEVSNKKWFENTLFIITSDHTAQADSEFYQNKVGMYSIPLVFYRPADSLLRGVRDKIAQQTDIFPSVIDYIGFEDTVLCYGNSVFDTTATGFSVNYINGIYQLIQNHYSLQFDGKEDIAFYNFKDDSLLRENLIGKGQKEDSLINEYSLKLKAIIQSYQSRLIHNKMIYSSN